MTKHPVDSANEHLRELGYTPAEAQVYSVFGLEGESALLHGSTVEETFVALGDIAALVDRLPRALARARTAV